MGLLARLKQFTLVRNGQQVYTGPPVDDDADAGSSYSASVRRALRDAYKNPTVCSVVEWITDQATTTPYRLTQTMDDGEDEPVLNHPLLDLLAKPSEFLSGREHLALSIWDMLLEGQCFWRKDRNRAGQIGSLTYLMGRNVTVQGGEDPLIDSYKYRTRNGKATTIYPVGDIVHIRIKPDPFDPKNGLSPLICLGTNLMIDASTGEYTASALSSQGAPGGILMPANDELLDEETAAETKKYIQSEFSAGKRGRLAVLRAEMKYINTSLDASANTLRAIKNMTQEEICGVLGVHPAILGLGAGATQTRVGAATIALEQAAWSNRIIPLTDTIAEQIGRQLLPDFEPDNPEEWEIGFDRSGVPVLQPDKKMEAERWVANVRAGIATRYDARVAQNLEADDLDKVYLLPTGIQVLAADAPIPDPEALEPDEPPEEEDETSPDDEGDEAEERSRVELAVLSAARSKAPLNENQRSLLLAFALDQQEIEADFTTALESAFEDLGQRAVNAFWEVEGGQSVSAMGNGGQTKQTKQEINQEVARILKAMRISQWVSEVSAPIFDAYYLRVLLTTVETVNSSLGLAVNIPDPVARQVVQQGGIRLGLIDVSAQSKDALFQAIFEGRSLGEGPAQLARRIQGLVPAGPYKDPTYRARLIARTETKYAQNVSSLESYRASSTITHILVVDAQGAGGQDAVCEAADGQQFTIAEADQLDVIVHPNCTRSFTPVVE